MIKRFLLACLFLSISNYAYADLSETLKQKSAEFRLGFETITLAEDESMGLVGGAYLIETYPGLYLGPAAYGAVTGERGGFFTGGGEIVYRFSFLSRASLEAGFYLGGGGGGGAGVGDGLMLRPHLDLLWDFGGFRAGVSASEVSFPSGHFASQQLGLIVAIDDRFLYADHSRVGQAIGNDRRGGLGFDRLAISVAQYRMQGNVQTTVGTPAPKDTSYAGFLVTQALNDGWLWGIEAAGAVQGSADGYAEVLATLGWEYPFASFLRVGGRAALGAGGGGAVDTGGGSLGKAAAYAAYQMSRDFALTLEAGRAIAFDGSFDANYVSLQLGMALDHPHVEADMPCRIEGWEWDGSMQHYSAAARRDGTKRSMQNIGFKLKRELEQGLYLTGQAHSALGGGAGGYSVGLFGMGWESSEVLARLSFSAEMLVGAAGGGGVESSGGGIIQPMAYASYPISSNWHLQAGAGVVKSLKGELESPVLDLSLGYRFGLPRR